MKKSKLLAVGLRREGLALMDISTKSCVAKFNTTICPRLAYIPHLELLAIEKWNKVQLLDPITRTITQHALPGQENNGMNIQYVPAIKQLVASNHMAVSSYSFDSQFVAARKKKIQEWQQEQKLKNENGLKAKAAALPLATALSSADKKKESETLATLTHS